MQSERRASAHGLPLEPTLTPTREPTLDPALRLTLYSAPGQGAIWEQELAFAAFRSAMGLRNQIERSGCR